MTRQPSESGAVLVQVAIAILVLTAMSTFVIDHGVLWLSRAQAQNAADSGALSGATARAFDELTNPPASDGKAFLSAQGAALTNLVWNAAPSAQVSWACPAGVVGSCVRVDVYRNGEFGSTPLPTMFGKLLNISSQGVRATATARVVSGNATNCMRPFAIADKWIERRAPVDSYLRWQKQGSTVVQLDPYDEYVPPSQNDAGSGYRLPDNFGAQVTLKNGNPNSNNETITPGWFLPIRLPDGNGGYTSGADDFRDGIANCSGHPVTIGQYLPTETGNMVGPTAQGVDILVGQDPGASWDSGNKQITGTCAPSCAPISPRIVPITIFDMDEFQWRREKGDWTSAWQTYPADPCPTGGRCVRVTNILGFFVDHMNGNDVIGYLTSYPGEFALGAPSVGGGAAFLMTIQLVQ
jgi:putative Flp pilus-assembly TadE/G-like protein